jgi:polysaccharide deacetylase family protein (PEP-CTERM system associated)
MSAPRLRHALSFDIEDWFTIVGIDGLEDPKNWPSLTMPSLVINRTRQIIDTVAEAGVRGTFFILGWIADRYPEIAKSIAAAGHEIGTHSFWHPRVDRLTPEQFREDLHRSIEVLQQQTGKKVLGFRAPTFSITPGAEWAFDVMHDEGIAYDASLFPARRGHGGYPCPQQAHQFTKVPSGRPMLVLPMSIARVGPLRVPFSGGGYLRLFPGPLIRLGFRQFEKNNTPVVVYLHPRDFAPECPRVPMPLHRHFMCYVGTKTTQKKLQMLLRRYAFTTCADVLGLEHGPAETTETPSDSPKYARIPL